LQSEIEEYIENKNNLRVEKCRNIGNYDNTGSYTHNSDNTAETGSSRIDGDI
jgi:hypothetical protein